MYNTIRLVHGNGEICEKGDTIWGMDSWPIEVKRWSAEEKAEAIATLSKHWCSYWEQETYAGGKVTIGDEWALEYFDCDDDGEFVQGSDFGLAEEGD